MRLIYLVKCYRILVEMSMKYRAIRCCFLSESINFQWFCLIA